MTATTAGSARNSEGGGGRRGGRRVGGWPDGYGTGRGRREGEEGAREKDIKVRNSQRGERAPPRHRLDRGSLIPFLECSPLPPPPPSTTHPPPVSSATLPPLHRGPHDHPSPPTPSNWRAPEYVLYIHTRALMSVPVLLPALPLPPPPLQEWKRREKALGLGRKRDGGYTARRVTEATSLSRSTYTRAAGNTNV